MLEHPAFNINNPNCCYSTFLTFARSPINFHAEDGSGYAFLADSVLKVRCAGGQWCHVTQQQQQHCISRWVHMLQAGCMIVLHHMSRSTVSL